jgi:hypothetical protein
MSKSTAATTDFTRLYDLAQATLGTEIKTAEGLTGTAITCKGHIIAELTPTGHLWLKCPADQKVLLMDISPNIYFETDDLIGKDGILIRLNQITDQELALRLDDALASCGSPLSQN